MKELSVDKTEEYLKHVVSLESSVYAQEKAIRITDKYMSDNYPKLETISIPEEPKEPEDKVFVQNKGLEIMFLMIIVGIAVAGYILTSVSILWLFLLGIPFSIIFIVKLIKFVNEGDKAKRSEADKEAKYNEYLEQKKKYDAAKAQYNANLGKAKEEYDTKVAKYISITAPIKEKNQATLEETQRILNQVYDLDIIFPKYRNLPAMCTIYEYFQAGRVTELKGPNGAYNLYEQELRQNIVISNLEKINSNLEQIKQNQYLLYDELQKVNRELSHIEGTVNGIFNETSEIARNSQISAMCAKNIDKNLKEAKWCLTYSAFFD